MKDILNEFFREGNSLSLTGEASPNQQIFNEFKQNLARNVLQLPENERGKYLQQFEQIEIFNEDAFALDGRTHPTEKNKLAFLKAIINGEKDFSYNVQNPAHLRDPNLPEYINVKFDNLDNIRQLLDLENKPELKTSIQTAIETEENKNGKLVLHVKEAPIQIKTTEESKWDKLIANAVQLNDEEKNQRVTDKANEVLDKYDLAETIEKAFKSSVQR